MSTGDSEIGRLAARLDIDGALMAAVATKAWSGLAGILTLFLIGRELTVVEQGYYYAFWSLIALQSFVELGLLIVIVAAASHEWAHLQLDRAGHLQGHAKHVARFADLVRLVTAWFAFLAAIFSALAGVAGYVFLARAEHVDVSWQAPWATAIVLAAALLLLNSLLSLLEGCNQVRQVHRLRLAQAVGSSLVLWLALTSQWSLWSVSAMLGTSLLIGTTYVGVRYRRLLHSVARSRGRSDFSWKTDVWPMQWPLALQGVAAYFMFSLFVPVAFAYSGAAVATSPSLTTRCSASRRPSAMCAPCRMRTCSQACGWRRRRAGDRPPPR